MFNKRFEFYKKKYLDTDSHKLRSKLNVIDKLLTNLNETRKNEDWSTFKVIESQMFDVISELEYINYFENLLNIQLSDDNIDKKYRIQKKILIYILYQRSFRYGLM